MRTKSLLPIDKLNVISTKVDTTIDFGAKNKSEIIDEVLDLLILSYVYGTESANEDLETSIEPDVTQMDESINKDIAGKTWEARITEYVNANDPEGIKRVIDTESHRIYTEAQFNTAISSGLKIDKTWVTMLDEKVRDTHEFLEGVTVGLNEKFNTVDGDSAYAPGGFENAENNINCRCELVFSKR